VFNHRKSSFIWALIGINLQVNGGAHLPGVQSPARAVQGEHLA